MSRQIFNYILQFIVIILIQVLVCNNISILNIATPFIFIYLIIRLPITLHINWVLTISFLIGLVVDIFSDTYGMNSLACTLTGGIRNFIINLYLPRKDEITDPVPSMKSLNIATYMKYAITMIVCYCTFIVFIEFFTVRDILSSLLRIFGSSILSFVLIIRIDSIVNTKNEKRL